MAVTFQQLLDEVSKFSVKSNETLSRFSYPEHFVWLCKGYLESVDPLKQQRFSTLNFDGLIVYNYHKGPEGLEFEKCTGYATLEDVKNWHTAIQSLQKYCRNLLLAPRRQDFHQIKFSTGYYQYNIARNFKGAEKILEAMGYGIPISDQAKPILVKMELKDPKKLLEENHKAKLAKVLVDLMLFDFELDILEKCIDSVKSYRPNCTIMEAWIARNNACGIQNAVNYLYQNSPAKNVAVMPKNTNRDYLNKNPPANSGVAGQPRNMGGEIKVKAAIGHVHRNLPGNNVNMGGEIKVEAAKGHVHRNPPGNNVTEQPFDPSTLPPPDLGEMSGEFGSVPQHINPSSHIDDDENQLIKDSTQLGYRNPPEAKLQGAILSSSQPMMDPMVNSPNRPPMSPTVAAPPNRDDKFHLEISRSSVLGQDQYVDRRNEFQHGNTQPPNMSFSSNTARTGGLHSFPGYSVSSNADDSGASTHLGSSHAYSRQKSLPHDPSLSSGSEKEAVITTGTTKSNQLPVSDRSPVMADVPLTNRPAPEASRAPPTSDSKFGKTNLNYLKNRLQHTKEMTQTVYQTGATGSNSSSDYVNAETVVQPFQGASDGTNKSTAVRTDLPSLRNKLEKTKEERERTVVAANKKSDYCNLSDVTRYIPENPVIITNPPDKKPAAGRRTLVPANTVFSNTYSALSTSSRAYKLWQCAHCQGVNEAHCGSCDTCKLPYGKMAGSSYLCKYCDLMLLLPSNRERKDACCPLCKRIFESTL